MLKKKQKKNKRNFDVYLHSISWGYDTEIDSSIIGYILLPSGDMTMVAMVS